MPLPTADQVWPPEDLAEVTAQLNVWSAWYAGDLDTISGIYGGDLAGDPARPQGILNPTRDTLRGRIGRTIARWFWGVRTPDTERRTKLHVPMARDIATTSADILFGEPPVFQVKDKTAQKRVDLLTGAHMRAALTEGAELAAGMGGVYYRICWDTSIRERPWLSPVHADAAIPEWRWDALVAVTFWRDVEVDGNTVYRHLERHEPGHILHGIYRGGAANLGEKVEGGLNSFPGTKGLKEDVATGTPRLTAAYVPNMRPAPSWRHVPAAQNLGRADFDGCEPEMDALDEVYSSLMRDIRLGRARLHVPAPYLESLGPGKGSVFEDRDLYVPVTALGTNKLDSGLQMEMTQFQIRVDEHLRAAADLMTRIAGSSGYSAQTFGLQGDGGMATATEVDARKDRTTATRAKKVNYVAPELSELAFTMQVVDKALNPGQTYTPEQPDVDMGDGVTESPRQVAETVKLLADAEAASIATRVQMVHQDWDRDRVLAEVAEIRAQQAMFDAGDALTRDIQTGRDPSTGRNPDGPPDPPEGE